MRPIDKNIEKLEKGRYAVAPYNFVSFPSESVSRYDSIDSLPGHDSFSKDGLLKGTIEYTFTAETPVFVSNGSKEKAGFFKDTNGDYAIPGNTVRGLVRENVQILGFSDVVGKMDENGKYSSSEIADSRFLYRDFAGSKGSVKDRYTSTLGINPIRGAQNIDVGHMYKKNGSYFIKEAAEALPGKGYVLLDEIKLRKIAKSVSGINYMYGPELVNHEAELKKLNADKKKREVGFLLKKTINRKYAPYCIEISYDFETKKDKGKTSHNVVKIGNPGECSKRGYLMASNHIDGKRKHYLIGATADGCEEKVPESLIEGYKSDLILTKKMKKSGEINSGFEYYDLPKSGETKPVFYIKQGDHIHFGFTQFLRIFYDKTVLDGVSRTYKGNPGIGYSDAMFGFINKRDESYKSRVGFEDAKALNPMENECSISVILGEPRATSYKLYVSQKMDRQDHNFYDGDFEIRGFKQYWLKSYVEKASNIKNENVATELFPLKEGTQFKGKIRFENLHEDELGLLLMSLKLKENSYQNIGMGKPYGLGRIRVDIDSLELEDIEAKYSTFSFDYEKDASEDIDRYIHGYKKYVSINHLGNRNFEELENIREFHKIKTKVIDKDHFNNYRYMSIDEKEFRDTGALPRIMEYESYMMKSIKSSQPGGHKNHAKSKGHKGGGQKRNFSTGSENEPFNNPFAKLKGKFD